MLRAAFPKVEASAAVSKPKQRLSGLAALSAISQEDKGEMASRALGKLLDDLVTKKYSKEKKAITDAVDKIKATGYYDLEGKAKEAQWGGSELSKLFDFKYGRERAIADLPASMEAVKKSIVLPAGDMYFLKTLLIAANEARSLNGNLEEARHIVNLGYPRGKGYSAKDTNGGRPVYDFSGNSMTNYDKVHMEPSHYTFCQLAVEYLWRKTHEANKSETS
jgi:hypothetical protein